MDPIILNKNLKDFNLFEKKYKNAKEYRGNAVLFKILHDRTRRRTSNRTSYYLDEKCNEFNSGQKHQHHFIVFKHDKLKPKRINYDFGAVEMHEDDSAFFSTNEDILKKTNLDFYKDLSNEERRKFRDHMNKLVYLELLRSARSQDYDMSLEN